MKHFFILFFTLYTSALFAQTNTQQIIGSAGNSVSSGTAQLSWSVGEPITKTGSNGGIELAQGFHHKTLKVTSLDELSDHTVSIYPNPTSDFAIIELNDKKLVQASFTLTDMQGRIIQTKEIEGPKLYVNFKDLPAAAYIIQVSKQDKVRTFKVIKN